MKYYISAILFVLVLLIPIVSYARENVDYWYIKDFKTEITVSKDSSLVITEEIVADCGTAQKHGIFRVLPTFQQVESNKKINSPIELISITDFDNKPYKHTINKDQSDKTVSWKIGDENVFISGVNNYRIKYKVKNAIRHNSDNFDEFYWNLTGNYWDMDIDSLSAKIIFPEAINKRNTEANIYSGSQGEKNHFNLSGSWTAENIYSLAYPQTIQPGEGITASITFPKGIITPYVPTFWEKYGVYFFVLIPLIVLALMYIVWKKVGDDPSINPTVAPEFEIPENLSPIDMGLVWTDGILRNNFISAGIINLAVQGALKIEKVGKKDFKLTKTDSDMEISASEKQLLKGLFESKIEVQISDLKNKFYTHLPQITQAGTNSLVSKKWLVKNSRFWQYVFIFIGFSTIGLGFWAGQITSAFGFSLIASAIIIITFSFFLPRRSKEGAVLARRIKGLRLYLHTAERYRAKFNEKENIFEKFLPYAILFGLTKEWINKMRTIYGAEYFTRYHPVWFYGASIGNFNVDSLASEISSMSSNMASTISSSPSSSGSGGSGFSGGGGGGGGGGGW